MQYSNRKSAIIILEDGTTFFGKSIGIDGTAFGEVCFNTGMTGYQEIFTDPSYYGQLMVTTNAYIGNYGVRDEEVESDSVKIAGLICRNFTYNYSRHGETKSLFDFLKANNIVAISDVDTRALVSYIRDNGAMNAAISTKVDEIDILKMELSKIPSMDGLELASKVSTKEIYHFGNESAKYKISALDLGIKKNILRNLEKRDCYIKVFPYNSTFEEMNDWAPHAFFISNGPGDPKPLINAQNIAKEVIKKNIPLFGICLGHQIIALANGISTYKMHNGHRGINHPVKNLKTGLCEITSQNHGFGVNEDDIKKNKNVEVTHINLNDGTIEGIKLIDKDCFSVQYHPEASPGPHDSRYLFDDFIHKVSKR